MLKCGPIVSRTKLPRCCADETSSPGINPGDQWQILTQPANIQEPVEVPEREEVVG